MNWFKALSPRSRVAYQYILPRFYCQMDPKEQGKKNAGYAAVDNHIKNGYKVGVGSGSTVVYVVDRIAERIKEEGLQVLCVPTSYQSRLLLVDNKIPHTDLVGCSELDVCIDGADEADSSLTLIKGGGGCQLQEKLVATAARLMVVVADDGKKSVKLGEKWKKGVPIEVIPMAQALVCSHIKNKLGYLTEETLLRQAKSKAGPVVTDNGNFILDWRFKTDVEIDWPKIDQILHMIPGVVETGLFCGMATHAYFGSASGVEHVAI